MAGASVWQILRAHPASSRSATVAPSSVRERRFVQQESTATGADLTGLVRTLWDGDLHRSTRVDVLPGDGMQEARGSSPLSSTPVQIGKFEILSPPFYEPWYSSKIQQRSSTICLSATGSWSRHKAELLAWLAEGICQDRPGVP